MTNNELRWWLKGFAELCGAMPMERKQVAIINNHINLVKAVSGDLDEENKQFAELTASVMHDNTSEGRKMLQAAILRVQPAEAA